GVARPCLARAASDHADEVRGVGTPDERPPQPTRAREVSADRAGHHSHRRSPRVLDGPPPDRTRTVGGRPMTSSRSTAATETARDLAHRWVNGDLSGRY